MTDHPHGLLTGWTRRNGMDEGLAVKDLAVVTLAATTNTRTAHVVAHRTTDVNNEIITACDRYWSETSPQANDRGQIGVLGLYSTTEVDTVLDFDPSDRSYDKVCARCLNYWRTHTNAAGRRNLAAVYRRMDDMRNRVR